MNDVGHKEDYVYISVYTEYEEISPVACYIEIIMSMKSKAVCEIKKKMFCFRIGIDEFLYYCVYKKT